MANLNILTKDLWTRSSLGFQTIVGVMTSALPSATAENPFQYDYPLQQIILRINETATGTSPNGTMTPSGILVKQKLLLGGRSIPPSLNPAYANPALATSTSTFVRPVAENWEDSTGWVIGIALAIVFFSAFVAVRCLCWKGRQNNRKAAEDRAFTLERRAFDLEHAYNAHLPAHPAPVWYIPRE
jgi:hypothetical protein